MTVRGTHGAVRQGRMATVTAAQLNIPVFQGVRCDRCKAGLHDSEGNPRWEILGKLEFVCVGGCKPGKGNAVTASGSPVLRTSHRTSHPGGERRG